MIWHLLFWNVENETRSSSFYTPELINCTQRYQFLQRTPCISLRVRRLTLLIHDDWDPTQTLSVTTLLVILRHLLRHRSLTLAHLFMQEEMLWSVDLLNWPAEQFLSTKSSSTLSQLLFPFQKWTLTCNVDQLSHNLEFVWLNGKMNPQSYVLQ